MHLGKCDVAGTDPRDDDRWAWTSNSTNGMLEIWAGDANGATAPKFDAGQRLSENNKTMYSAAAPYSGDTGGLPIE